MMLYYQWGFNEKEIADCFGFTESRASQIKGSAEKKISGSLSCEESRDRERQKQAEISRQIQVRSKNQDQIQRKLEAISNTQRQRLGTRAIEKIQKTLFVSFAAHSF